MVDKMALSSELKLGEVAPKSAIPRHTYAATQMKNTTYRKKHKMRMLYSLHVMTSSVQ